MEDSLVPVHVLPAGVLDLDRVEAVAEHPDAQPLEVFPAFGRAAAG
jgi:hypothetical protein